MEYSRFTDDLFKQYRKHLGPLRYRLLREVQTMTAPKKVRELLCFRRAFLLRYLIMPYKWGKKLKLDRLLKALLLPSGYKAEVKALDVLPG